MSHPERSGGHRRLLPRSVPGAHERRGTVMGLGVPLAPSFLDLDDEETVAYNARRTPAVSLPALRAECLESGDSSPIALDDADTEIVSTPKFDTTASTIHRIGARPTIDDFAPPRSTVRVSLATKATTRSVASEPKIRQRRVGVTSHPPQSGRRVRSHPSQERSVLLKLAFLVMFVMVLIVVSTEISIACNLPWLDCRPHLFKAWKLVSQKVPWESLPKLPRF